MELLRRKYRDFSYIPFHITKFPLLLTSCISVVLYLLHFSILSTHALPWFCIPLPAVKSRAHHMPDVPGITMYQFTR